MYLCLPGPEDPIDCPMGKGWGTSLPGLGKWANPLPSVLLVLSLDSVLVAIEVKGSF